MFESKPADVSKSIAGAPSMTNESNWILRLFLPAIAADCPPVACKFSNLKPSSIESSQTTLPVPENCVASTEDIEPETSVKSNPDSIPTPMVMLDANISVCLAQIAGPLQYDMSKLENSISASD